ncbi:redoxin domain-containing protein [Halalkalicoccus jeotgali]|uniref:Alkyl hydroperoxide reductase/ Thiol specific antioxidant/ Mal allergen n=1 Tax=Halalkalicoccus jeotgali (strain DSM 18796 / CECT 7217 / JCM 14584 / KCTC 4019 / B3) TaxID=795797 RepID=D8J8M6_HALJB|nr:redoxin domain-containing protein [Halalkalicoccus jeotgali]ADJ14211.1 alkyl hydroperoxide reductase/ Thiol specific antioxidant/ Mal allergen [Halalkalicoccus jeotgali B3]ELY34607.1 alkyl hydroperoxide reductase/ Thiol specific antioxidant/ Mal allergen [Halalkalicoccus jeotgali B3]
MELEFDVVDLGEADHPIEGEEAPDFVRPLVNDEYWEDVALSELTAEGPVLLVFYPMDGDFPATYIWNELRDRGLEETADVTVVGLSISSPYEHTTFIDERGMDYRLFSDPQNGVAEAYGIVNDLDGMAGISEPRPAVFLLDSDRTIRYAWVARQWPDFPDYDELEARLADR